MQSKKIDGPEDDRIGGAPSPMTHSQKLIQRILELQNEIRNLERELQRQTKLEEMAAIRPQAYSDYAE